MPIIVCTSRAGLGIALKQRIAREITQTVHETIKSSLNIISVVFNDLASESSYVGGEPGSDTLIMCNIRAGRSEEAKVRLVKNISQIWHHATGQSEDHIETGLLEYTARYIIRGGEQMPEPPYA